jgi:dTDP-4-dehydrorhamnose reductase
MNLKLLVTGAAGMLGSALCPTLEKRGHIVYATDIVQSEAIKEYLDVRIYKQVKELLEKVKPDMVMHLAAETDVDNCEVDPDHAFLTNTIGTQNLALTCQKQDTEMVYISTIGVFHGDKPEPYTEFDQPNPINVYGKSKLEGEKIVQNMLKRYYIVRAGWMVGGGPTKDKKFVGKIIRLSQEKTNLKAVDDKIGSPTYTFDFCNCLANLIETGFYGLYHCTNKGYCSRFDVAKWIIAVLGKSNVIVEPVNSAYFPLPAARARSEMSRNYKLELLGMDTTRHWKAALEEYITLYWNTKDKKVPSA